MNFKSLLLKYEGNFPRYTSYPTAPYFSDKVNTDVYKNWLLSLEDNQEVSFYFHIPFCHQLCWYCGCFTKITQRYKPIKDYLGSLIGEIDVISKIIKNKNLQVCHIHFGGGSPNILSVEDFELLTQKIKDSFVIKNDAEIAIEIDPRTTDKSKIISYVKSGINRVSIGVQDFDSDVQLAINRVQDFDVVNNCINLCRQNGIDSINIDLIYGLPKQTIQSIIKTIDLSVKLNPSRIALFAYAHVKWKKKHMRLIFDEDLPDSSNRIEMYDVASNKIKEAGYFAIGLDHFSKENDEMYLAFVRKDLRRNFQGYSTDKSDVVIGFGISSIGYFKQGYVQNTLDFEEYKQNILDNKLAVKKGIAINKEDKIRKFVIDSIMCYMSVDLKMVCAKFNLSDEHFISEIAKLKVLQEDGLITFNNNVITVNSKAVQICRVVSSVFDQNYDNSEILRYSKSI